MRRDAKIEAERIQREAADPGVSIVLGAAAGSGKTKVLIDRFVRLCLAGAAPKSILAITFTRKAAVEIKGRLLTRARCYARADDQELVSQLQDLLGRPPTAEEMSAAAGLYEAVLEDLTGLNVGTIHSFCQLILARFAPEVGLDPHFKVLEKIDEIWAETLERLAAETAGDPDRLNWFAQLANRPAAAHSALRELLDDRVALQRWLDRVGKTAASTVDGHTAENSATMYAADSLQAPVAHLCPDLVLDLHEYLFSDTILAGNPNARKSDLCPPLCRALVRFLESGLPALAEVENDDLTAGFRKQRDAIQSSCEQMIDRLAAGRVSNEVAAEIFDEIGDLLLTRNGMKLRSFNGRKITKDERQFAFQAAAAPLLKIWLLAGLVERFHHNRRLLALGLQALDIFTELKHRDRCVDFHDLEYLALRLMRSPELGPYIQFRLDEQIDHLLLDEFQDTNHNQWEIVEPLVQEFMAGGSDRPRSLFFVGDIKQAIYGFRGAEPTIFKDINNQLDAYDNVKTLNLPTNFRSTQAVVESVGELFNVEPLATAITPAEALGTRQLYARDEVPGTVEIIRPFAKTDDGVSGDLHAACATADIIRRLIDGSYTGKECAYRDILVLCRSRTHMAAYEQVLRQAGIPLVPAGRGQLARSREVRDILDLLRWLSYPADDLALASVLRSPLLRISEALLQTVLGRCLRYDAAVGRQSLWDVLRHRSSEPDLVSAVKLLNGWRKCVGRYSCHDLLRRIYREGQARDRFAAALGEQARYNLLRLHDLALSPEIAGGTSTRRFIELVEWAARTGSEEEAPLPGRQGSGRVRLMTIHGAKGLQAPVVLLVDADARVGKPTGRLILGSVRNGAPVLYAPGRLQMIGPELPDGATLAPLSHWAERAESSQVQEEANLVYVALTRAEDSLFILGGQSERKGNRSSALEQLEQAALVVSETKPPPFRVIDPDEYGEMPTGIEDPASQSSTTDQIKAEEYRTWQPSSLREIIKLVTPSSSESFGEKTAIGPGGQQPDRPENTEANGAERIAAQKHGDAVHLWLQRAAERGAMPLGEGQAWQEAAAVFEDPRWRWIFKPEQHGGKGYSEVPVIARLPRAEDTGPSSTEQRIAGRIDRLVVRPDRVDIIDYKSQRKGVSEDLRTTLAAEHRPQLQAYFDAIQVMFPERQVNAFVLFTRAADEAGQGHLAPVITNSES